MAFPLLAKLGLALLASKMQNDEAKKAHAHAQQQQLDQTLMNIRAKRAARAGDSGYMHTALGGMEGMPKKPKGALGPMLVGMGGALLSQPSEPETAQTPSLADKWSDDKLQWAGKDFDDEDKYRNLA
jgi:hypothetical protein